MRQRARRGGTFLTRGADPAARERTQAEAFYYQKQIEARTPLVAVLRGGESLRGRLRWYDDAGIGLVTEEGRELHLAKVDIKYLHKEEPVRRGSRRPGS